MAHGTPQGRMSVLIGILLVGLGAMFLLGQLFNINLISYLWPFFVIVPGLLFFVGMLLGGKQAGPLAIPGSIVTMTGLLLLYQSITGHWESWAYAWTLIFPTSVGIGLVIHGAWSEIERLRQTGMKWITGGLVLFLLSGMFFELILGISGGLVSSVIWPVMLILLGVFLLVRRSSRSGGGPAGGSREGEESAPAEPVIEGHRGERFDR
ncbi:MAG: hypothetical protein GX484_05790 [Chloroflexi bacterium]|nr:hypothetical protein [Chloroflexota bacterium]